MRYLFRNFRLSLALIRARIAVVLFCLLVSAVALAQTGPSIAGASLSLATVEHWILMALAAGAVGLLFKLLFGFLDSYDQRTQAAAAAPGASEALRVRSTILHLVDVVAHGLVAKLEPELRAQAAAGKLDPNALLKDGLAELKQLITVDHIQDVKSVLGVAESMLWPYLEHMLAARFQVALAGVQASAQAAAPAAVAIAAAPTPAPAPAAAPPSHP